MVSLFLSLFHSNILGLNTVFCYDNLSNEHLPHSVHVQYVATVTLVVSMCLHSHCGCSFLLSPWCGINAPPSMRSCCMILPDFFWEKVLVILSLFCLFPFHGSFNYGTHNWLGHHHLHLPSSAPLLPFNIASRLISMMIMFMDNIIEQKWTNKA